MNDSTNTKRPYEAPRLTVVRFKTERGYAASGELTGTNSIFLGAWISENASQGTYVDRNDYGSTSSSIWD